MNRLVWILVGEHPTLAPYGLAQSVYEHEHLANETINQLRQLYPENGWTYRLHKTQLGVI